MFFFSGLVALLTTFVSIPFTWNSVGPWSILLSPLFGSFGYLVATLVLITKRDLSTQGDPKVGDRKKNSVLKS